jgi:2,4-dienoyl-CoA reductase-like NADH-dependent reductase (Old Yellow Enzyme family)
MSLLFSPLDIGPVRAPNRIALAPMCMYSASQNGCASDWHLQHFMTYAMSGAGVVMTEATAVAPEGRLTPGCLGLWSDENEAALKRALDAARAVALPGVRFGVQLAHAGRKASAALPWNGGKPLAVADGGWRRLAPSPLPFGPGWPEPDSLDEPEIARIIAAYAEAARRAARIGFDIVEVHTAHGGLPHQFHSPIANKRNDDWGGDENGRLRFVREMAEALREATPDHVALGARINANDYFDGGLVLDDAIVLARDLKDRGFAYVCVSSGNIAPGGRPATGVGFNMPNAARVRAATGLVTRAAGLIYDAEQAEGFLAEGAVDQVAVGRALLDNPRWGWHAAERLGAKLDFPRPYAKASAAQWAGAKLVRPSASPE